MIASDWIQALVEELGLVHPALVFYHRHQSLEPETHVRGVAQWVHEVADLDSVRVDLAAVTADLSVAPFAFRVVNHIMAEAHPDAFVIIPVGVDVHWVGVDLQILKDLAPEFARNAVVGAIE